MATLKDLDNWIRRDLSRSGAPDSHMLNTVEHKGGGFYEGPRGGHGNPPETVARYMLYTRTNRYSIKAVEREGGPTETRSSYLGCIANCRMPRAGENWTRGSDLADGELTEATWHRILGDILSYEMVKVHASADIEPDVPCGPPQPGKEAAELDI